MKIKFTALFLLVFFVAALVPATSAQDMEVTSADVDVTSGGEAYKSYMAAPASGGPYPAVVLIHSFRGLEEGYRTMTDELAARGFVVLSVGWQTFEQSPSDDVVKQLVDDSIAMLKAREDVDPERIGLTGFCAGGRYTMLLLPQVEGIKAGVAWYGFPNNEGTLGKPVDHIAELTAPMLIIHGTNDQPSPIAGIYDYANQLQAADAYFEMKVYFGEPHGFMLAGGQLRQDEVAVDAFNEMADFFTRKLGA
ncbi:MAG: dienelactone hydrolase family protein [Anaerolineae bacterium]